MIKAASLALPLVILTAFAIAPATRSSEELPVHPGPPPHDLAPLSVHPVPVLLRPSIFVAGAREAVARPSGDCDFACEKIAAVGRWARANGYQVSEHPLFGGVCYCHVSDSAHYVGHAIDVNSSFNEMARLDDLYSVLDRIPGIVIYWRTYGHWDHLHAEFDH